MPQSLDRLVSRLRDAALPASPAKLDTLRQIQHRRHLSAGQVATLASGDPGLSLTILRAVHEPILAANLGYERPSSLGHAVVLLGVDACVAALLKCPDPSGLDEHARAGYYRLAAQAAFAAHCARAWGQHIADPAPDELHLAAYCHYLAELALWVEEPDIASALEHGHRHEKDGGVSCEQAILGGNLAQCTEVLGIQWGLPELTCNVPAPGSADEIRSRMRDPQERRKITVQIAIELGRTGNLGWLHPSPERAVVCSEALLRKPADRIRQELHSHAAACAREHSLESAFSPALALVLVPDEVLPKPRPRPKPASAKPKTDHSRTPQGAPLAVQRPADLERGRGRGAKSTITANTSITTNTSSARATPTSPPLRARETITPPFGGGEAPAGQGARNAPSRSIQATSNAAPRDGSTAPNGGVIVSRALTCTQSLKRFLTGQCSVSDFLLTVASGITVELDLDRALVAIVTPDKDRLRARFLSRLEDKPLLSGFDFSLAQPHVFARLMTKRTSVWVKSDDPRFERLIPPNLIALTGATEFFAMSVFADDRAVGLIYADSFERNQLTEQAFVQFRKLGKQTGSALARARNPVKRAS